LIPDWTSHDPDGEWSRAMSMLPEQVDQMSK
jgi:hypothetical protein